ncbi:MAG: T9SS type A sorting domain-containing protein [Ignavibacteriae bacterium]|nr:T9SS type A sorting domain-containing protein [Ignavibacteriota bacterium]
MAEVKIVQILTEGNEVLSVDTSDVDGYYNSEFDYIITRVTQNHNLPNKFTIGNYPNPYNPSTNIVFNIAENGNYKLEVFDITGARIVEQNVGSINKGSYEYSVGNLGSAGVKLARLIGKTTSGKDVQITAKLLQMDGDNGTPFVEYRSSGNALNKTVNTNEQINLQITYTYLGDLNPSYITQTVNKTYESTVISDEIDIVLDIAQLFAQGIFSGKINATDGTTPKSEIKIYDAENDDELLAIDTTNTDGTYETLIDKIKIEQGQTTKDLKFEVNPLVAQYLQQIINESASITDGVINKETNVTLEKEVIENTRIPLTVKNILHERIENMNIYVENAAGTVLEFPSDANGNVMLDIPANFGDNVKIYHKHQTIADDQFVQFGAIQNKSMFGIKNKVNFKVENGVILNYMEASLTELKACTDVNDSLNYKVIEKISDANSYGFNGKFDMTNPQHIDIILSAH